MGITYSFVAQAPLHEVFYLGKMPWDWNDLCDEFPYKVERRRGDKKGDPEFYLAVVAERRLRDLADSPTEFHAIFRRNDDEAYDGWEKNLERLFSWDPGVPIGFMFDHQLLDLKCDTYDLNANAYPVLVETGSLYDDEDYKPRVPSPRFRRYAGEGEKTYRELREERRS